MKALILNHVNDRVLPIEKSREVAKKLAAAEVVEGTATGHYQILGAEQVLEKVVTFLKN